MKNVLMSLFYILVIVYLGGLTKVLMDQQEQINGLFSVLNRIVLLDDKLASHIRAIEEALRK